MTDDREHWTERQLTPEQMAAIDMSKPVTRSELIQAMLAMHQALFAQVQLLQIVAGHIEDGGDFRRQSLDYSGGILKSTADIMRVWSDTDAA